MRKNLVLCLILSGVVLTGLTGCTNSSISNSPDTTASIQMSQYDASLKMKKIGGNAISLQDGFANQVQKMIAPTVTPTSSDYSILTSSLTSVKDGLASNINELKTMNVPTASKSHKDSLLNALNTYSEKIDDMIEASQNSSIDGLSNAYSSFQNASIALQGVINQIS